MKTCGNLAVAVMVSAGLLIGCGGDGGGEVDVLDRPLVSSFKANAALVSFGADPRGDYRAELLSTVDDLIALAREDPDAIYEGVDGPVTMRQVLSDAATELQSAEPDLAAQLDRAVETLE